MQDLSWASYRVRWILRARRFVCGNAKCRKKTFAERLGEAVKPYARRTLRAQARLEKIGLALGGKAGTRIVKAKGLNVGPDTLLRAIRSVPLAPRSTPRVLNVDDFAFRKGLSYGTLLLDLETHQVVDVLADRAGENLAQWLMTHPGSQVVSRDRASAYAGAIARELPQAVQIADRFHLAHNLSEWVERIVKRHYPNIKAHMSVGLDLHQSWQKELPLGRNEALKEQTYQRRLLRYNEVKLLHDRGYNEGEIGEHLKMNRRQVIKLLAMPPQLASSKLRATKLDSFKGYLKRWFNSESEEDKCRNSLQLYREIKARGYDGSNSAVVKYVTVLRHELGDDLTLTGKLIKTSPTPLQALESVPSPRTIVNYFMQPQEKLSSYQEEQLARVLHSHEELKKSYILTRQFMGMVRHRRAEGLTDWLGQLEGSGIGELVSFSKGLRRDHAAVEAALSSRWSQGPIEGKINKLKTLKRTMYGRANFDLLRLRVLPKGS